MRLVYIVLMLIASNTTFSKSLVELKKSHQTKLTKIVKDKNGLDKPPKGLFELVNYPTSLGKMEAYLSIPSDKSKKHPAIIWVTGGFPAGGVGDSAWKPRPASNDQSAKVYREKGLVMMYPSFRGDAGNPGYQEGFYGEVDDLLNALKYLKNVSYVDPNEIYLGGHSTGGTLALLAAASSKDFKAVFSFGPVSSPTDYGDQYALYDIDNETETRLRSPMYYLDQIKSPTFIIEGEKGNIWSLKYLREINKNYRVSFIEIKGADHFSVLAPINQFLAEYVVDSNQKIERVNYLKLQNHFDKFKAK